MPDNNDIRWATTTVVDQAAVDHEREFGTPQASGETIRIRVAQRVEYNLLTDPIEVHVHPVRVHVGDTEYSVGQARASLGILDTAVLFAEAIEAGPSPE